MFVVSSVVGVVLSHVVSRPSQCSHSRQYDVVHSTAAHQLCVASLVRRARDRTAMCHGTTPPCGVYVFVSAHLMLRSGVFRCVVLPCTILSCTTSHQIDEMRQGFTQHHTNGRKRTRTAFDLMGMRCGVVQYGAISRSGDVVSFHWVRYTRIWYSVVRCSVV